MDQSFESVSKFNKELVDGAIKSATAWTNGVQTVAAESAEYAKVSMENGVAAFEKVANAKSAEKAFEVQSEFAKTSIESAVAQATKVGEIYTDVAKEVFKPFESVFTKVR
ncbi:MAG: phasin family protein [Rhizobiaceae bacterium]